MRPMRSAKARLCRSRPSPQAMMVSKATPTAAAVISTASGRLAVAITSRAIAGRPSRAKTFQIPVTRV